MISIQADAELEEALPAYEVSRHQADSISNDSILQFTNKGKNHPKEDLQIMKAVLILLG